MKARILISGILLAALSLFVAKVQAVDMQSPCYYLQMGDFNIASGGKTSGSYHVSDTAGQTADSTLNGSTDVKAGFQHIYPLGHASPPPFPRPCPLAFATPTPSATAIPSPTPTPNIVTQITNVLTTAGLITPVIATQIGSLIQATLPVVAASLPLAVVALAAAQAFTSLLPVIFEFISKLLQSIGLIPVKRPRGVVFDTKTGKGIPFATISFTRVSDNQIVDTVVSDVHGIYRSIKLPRGIYRIEVVHGDYLFPSKLAPKFALNPHDFYRGEPFEIAASNQEELFLIPMDPLFEEASAHRPLSFYFSLTLQILRRLIFDLFYPIVVFSVVITLVFPTILNIAIVALYVVMILYRVRHTKREPPLMGVLIDRYGRPIPDVTIRAVESQTNQVSALLLSDSQGRFRVNLPPLKYTLVINKDGYVIEQRSRDYANVFVTHTGSEDPLTIRLMTVKEAFPEVT